MTRSPDAARSKGDALFQCWADFDTFLMEDVVPYAPYLFDNSVDIISDNVINYSFDQFAGSGCVRSAGRGEQGLIGEASKQRGSTTMRRGSRQAAPSRRARIRGGG